MMWSLYAFSHLLWLLRDAYCASYTPSKRNTLEASKPENFSGIETLEIENAKRVLQIGTTKSEKSKVECASFADDLCAES